MNYLKAFTIWIAVLVGGSIVLAIFGLMAVMIATNVFAQSTAQEQALSNRLLFEINTTVQCGAELITARARIAELEKKLAAQ